MRNLSKQAGAATITFTAIILFILGVTMVFAAQSTVKIHTITSNTVNTHQATNAAQAGLDFGIANLIENVGSINDGDSITATLGNGSSYTATYSFVGGSNDVVRVVSQGVSDSGSTRTMEMVVKALSSSASFPTTPVGGRGDVTLRSNSVIRNLYGPYTIVTGDDVEIRNNSYTELTSGIASTKNNIGSDISQGDSTVSNMTDDELQTSSFGSTIAELASTADVSYTNSSNYNYKTELDGTDGQTVYITQTNGSTGSFGSNASMGTSSSPMLVIVSGDFEVRSNVEINGTIIATGNITVNSNAIVNGLVFALGDITLDSNSEVHGAVMAGGETVVESNSLVNYEPNNMGTTPTSTTTTTSGGYAIVTGSWKDF